MFRGSSCTYWRPPHPVYIITQASGNPFWGSNRMGAGRTRKYTSEFHGGVSQEGELRGVGVGEKKEALKDHWGLSFAQFYNANLLTSTALP